jgi:thioredoxin-like negative regulator of GroEL
VPTRTPRMDQIEALLADDPGDSFLRYSLALEHASAGDDATAADHLLRLLADTPYVPGFLMAGQILNRLNRVDEAGVVLRRGIEVARQHGESHAEGEMAGLLSSIE